MASTCGERAGTYACCDRCADRPPEPGGRGLAGREHGVEDPAAAAARVACVAREHDTLPRVSISRDERWKAALRRPKAALALAVSITLVPSMAFAGAGGPAHLSTMPAASGVAAAVPGAVSQALMMAKKKKSGGGGGLTPADAESKREAIRAAVAEDVKAERWSDAADTTEDNAAQLGDPLSFRDAAQHRLAQARKDRDIDAAKAAIETAKVSLDILHYYDAVASGEVESEWQPIEPSSASSMISEVEGIVDEAEELIAEIEAEQAASETGDGGKTPAGKTKKKRDRKPGQPGTLFIALGAAFTAVGVGGVSLAVAGLVISSSKQKEVEKLTLPQDQDRVDELDKEGSRANLLSYVGAGVAVAGLAVGVPLLVVGVMRRKNGNPGSSAQLRVTPAVSRGFGGMALSGRF